MAEKAWLLETVGEEEISGQLHQQSASGWRVMESDEC